MQVVLMTMASKTHGLHQAENLDSASFTADV